MGDFEPVMQLSVDAPIDAGDMVLPDEFRTELNAGLEKLSIESGDAMGCVKLTVKDDFCPILSLPKDILRLIFKNHLSAADRLRARVTTGLWEVEAEESYAIKQLNIVDDVEYYENCKCGCVKMQQHDTKVTTMTLTKSMDVYVDGLAKLTANSTFNSILFKIDNPAYGDLLDTVEAIPVPRLRIEIGDEATRARILTEERVEQLARGRVKLDFRKPTPCVTAEMLLRFYERMESGADPLREITFHDVPAAVIMSALSTLGVDLPPESHLHVRHRNIEVYLWTEDFFIIFDDRIITIQACTLIKNEPGLFCIERCEVDGSKGSCLFSKDEIRQYLLRFPVIYTDEEE